MHDPTIPNAEINAITIHKQPKSVVNPCGIPGEIANMNFFSKH